MWVTTRMHENGVNFTTVSIEKHLSFVEKSFWLSVPIYARDAPFDSRRLQVRGSARTDRGLGVCGYQVRTCEFFFLIERARRGIFFARDPEKKP
jgi:hypothetical protein